MLQDFLLAFLNRMRLCCRAMLAWSQKRVKWPVVHGSGQLTTRWVSTIVIVLFPLHFALWSLLCILNANSNCNENKEKFCTRLMLNSFFLCCCNFLMLIKAKFLMKIISSYFYYNLKLWASFTSSNSLLKLLKVHEWNIWTIIETDDNKYPWNIHQKDFMRLQR